MTPPGIALVSVSEAAWEQQADAPRFYFDWRRTRDAQARLDAAFTPAVSLVAGLDVALGLVVEHGLEAAFAHHARLGRAHLVAPDEVRHVVPVRSRVERAVDGLRCNYSRPRSRARWMASSLEYAPSFR